MPAEWQAFAIDWINFFKISSGKPSSKIKPQDKYFGTAPHTATSLAVPHTASLPMSPPGKKIGSITKLSVENDNVPPKAFNSCKAIRA